MNNRERNNLIVMSVQVLCLFFALVFSGCLNVRLISDYDQQIDTSITAFQKKMETFLTSLERKAGRDDAKYEYNVAFYDEAKVDLSAVRVRAAAIPKNDITIKMIDKLQDSLLTLEKLHKEGPLGMIPPQEIYPLRSAFNTSCTAILKLELAKKRGEQGKSE